MLGTQDVAVVFGFFSVLTTQTDPSSMGARMFCSNAHVRVHGYQCTRNHFLIRIWCFRPLLTELIYQQRITFTDYTRCHWLLFLRTCSEERPSAVAALFVQSYPPGKYLINSWPPRPLWPTFLCPYCWSNKSGENDCVLLEVVKTAQRAQKTQSFQMPQARLWNKQECMSLFCPWLQTSSHPANKA